MAVTKRELHRRIAAARGEVAAMLFFALPGTKEFSKRFSKAQYATDRHIKGLSCVLNLLLDGEIDTPEGACGACGKPIRGGQKLIHTEDAGNFHASKRCWGKVDKRHLHRAETQREQDRDAHKRLKEARDYLKARGLIA